MFKKSQHFVGLLIVVVVVVVIHVYVQQYKQYIYI